MAALLLAPSAALGKSTLLTIVLQPSSPDNGLVDSSSPARGWPHRRPYFYRGVLWAIMLLLFSPPFFLSSFKLLLGPLALEASFSASMWASTCSLEGTSLPAAQAPHQFFHTRVNLRLTSQRLAEEEFA